MPTLLRCLVLLFALAACAPPPPPPQIPPPLSEVDAKPTPAPLIAGGAVSRPLGVARADFRRAAPQVEAVAQQVCIERGSSPAQCDFRILLIDGPNAPANAFLRLGRDGRPEIGITTALLTQTGGIDEIAFVLSHEAAHHIANHLPRQSQNRALGALVLGGLVASTGRGVSQSEINQAMDLGAFFGGRAYSQNFELEADYLGTFIAARAGYDPERGALLFTRPALQSGGGLLATHPASPKRMATVRTAADEIRRGQVSAARAF